MGRTAPMHRSCDERTHVQVFVRRGKATARTLTRARVLLKSDEGWTDAEIAEALDISEQTIRTIRQRWRAGGIEAVLTDKRQERRRQALNDEQAAHLMAVACSPVPDGHDHWTVRMLAGKAVELGYVHSLSPETVRQLLKKTLLKPWQYEQWCIPNIDADFVAAMEEVLELYAQPYAPAAPLVCFDEKPLVVHGEVREPLPLKPGHPQRYDYEYERLGTANLFVFVEPLAGRRSVEMTEQRTKLDFAQTIRWLVDEVYPDARVIRLVMDNLNTHTAASLYEAFEPAEARRIWQRWEVHYTPKHGSWLNMAEIEISIFERGCLSKRVKNFDHLWQHIETLAAERNTARAQIHWRFTCADARAQMHDLDPSPKIKLD
ncbi:MAG: IS630 family transposase [Ktedonobacteraceae bacterium]